MRPSDKSSDHRTGGREASSRVFHQAVESESLDMVEESAPTQMGEGPISGLSAGAVGGPATLGSSLPVNGMNGNIDRLLGTSSLKEGEM
jgi:hypothetical protein